MISKYEKKNFISKKMFLKKHLEAAPSFPYDFLKNIVGRDRKKIYYWTFSSDLEPWNNTELTVTSENLYNNVYVLELILT